VGYHLCGAHLRNRVRRYALKDENDQPDPSTADLATVNHTTARWVAEANAKG
jgi:hypothetical protein